MAKGVDWTKNHRRKLKQRALAEEIEAQKRKPNAAGKIPGFYRGPTKASLRSMAERLVKEHEARVCGNWLVSCRRCGRKWVVRIRSSLELNTVHRCACDHKQRLTKYDLKTPSGE